MSLYVYVAPPLSLHIRICPGRRWYSYYPIAYTTCMHSRPCPERLFIGPPTPCMTARRVLQSDPRACAAVPFPRFRVLKSNLLDGQTVPLSELHAGAMLSKEAKDIKVKVKKLELVRATKQYRTGIFGCLVKQKTVAGPMRWNMNWVKWM